MVCLYSISLKKQFWFNLFIWNESAGIFIPFCHLATGDHPTGELKFLVQKFSCGNKHHSGHNCCHEKLKQTLLYFCKILLFFVKQIKNSTIKEICINLAIKCVIKKVGCRNFRISENKMACRISVKFWISLIYTTPQRSYTTA